MFATLFLASTLVAPAAEAREEARSRAFDLVQKLADSSFKVREHASDQLVKLGAAAVDALRKGLAHPDAEVGERCRKLLPQALDFHLQEQIDKFLAKPDGPIPDDLPGLKRWIAITGANKESREMYAMMVKEHRRLLIDIEANPDRAVQKYQAFCGEIYGRARLGTVADRRELISRSELVLFFFLGGDANCRKGGGPTGVVPYIQANQFLNASQATEMLSGSGESASCQKLFLAWLEQERYLTLVRRGFQLASAANLKEAGPIAVKITGDKTSSPVARSYALLAAAKLFGAADLKKLEPLMDDKTVIGRPAPPVNGEVMSTEIRDIALGIAVQATGQKMTDYGFDRFREPSSAAIVTSYIYYALTDKKREEAIQKWKDWNAKK